MLTFLRSHVREKPAEEFNLISRTNNASVPLDTSCIWILSSRHDVEKQHVNCPVKSKNYKPNSSRDNDKCDVEDDFLRIKAALKIGAKILAKKTNPHDAPLIVYNGLPDQNVAFRKALANNRLTALGLPEYPHDKIIILDLNEDELHTPGQFKSMVRECESNPRLAKLNEEGINVTIVTSAYHGPRVRRLFDSVLVKPPLPKAKLNLHLVDRKFKRNCIERDLDGELNRTREYLEKGHIGHPRKVDWFSKRITSWTPLREIQGDPTELIERYELRTGKPNDRFRF